MWDVVVHKSALFEMKTGQTFGQTKSDANLLFNREFKTVYKGITDDDIY